MDGFAKRIAAGPNGVGIRERIDDCSFIEAEGGSGGSGPSGAIREAGDIAEIDVANSRKGGCDGIGQSGEGWGVERIECGPDGGFGPGQGNVFKLDG
jgi:hypothetical protein